VEGQDWRLHGQELYLAGARLHSAAHRAPSERGAHDHCEFCNGKLSGQAGDDVVATGWLTEDRYRWICDVCFADFRESLGFVVTSNDAARRGVELHDATVLEITGCSGVVVVRLEAFVHDDRESESCAGHWQRIDVRFYDATFERRGSGDQWILDGSLRVGEHTIESTLPIPFHEEGVILARLAGSDFELTVRAHRVWLTVAGPPRLRP
jgi:hypothetical protein